MKKRRGWVERAEWCCGFIEEHTGDGLCGLGPEGGSGHRSGGQEGKAAVAWAGF